MPSPPRALLLLRMLLGLGSTPVMLPAQIVERRGDQLFGTWDTPQLGSLREMQLLSHGTDRFAYGWYRNGSLWATSLELNLEFARRDGRVVGFTYKSSSEVVARGTRRP